MITHGKFQATQSNFADDTKLYSIIETIHNIAKLQQDLDNLQDWSRPLLLNLNFDKCKVMHNGKMPHSNYHVSDTTPPGGFYQFT